VYLLKSVARCTALGSRDASGKAPCQSVVCKQTSAYQRPDTPLKLPATHALWLNHCDNAVKHVWLPACLSAAHAGDVGSPAARSPGAGGGHRPPSFSGMSPLNAAAPPSVPGSTTGATVLPDYSRGWVFFSHGVEFQDLAQGSGET
jgi:hypothetical protein